MASTALALGALPAVCGNAVADDAGVYLDESDNFSITVPPGGHQAIVSPSFSTADQRRGSRNSSFNTCWCWLGHRVGQKGGHGYADQPVCAKAVKTYICLASLGLSGIVLIAIYFGHCHNSPYPMSMTVHCIRGCILRLIW